MTVEALLAEVKEAEQRADVAYGRIGRRVAYDVRMRRLELDADYVAMVAEAEELEREANRAFARYRTARDAQKTK